MLDLTELLTDEQAIAVVRIPAAIGMFAITAKILSMPSADTAMLVLKAALALLFGLPGACLLAQQGVASGYLPTLNEVRAE